jgi:hypothetical protein
MNEVKSLSTSSMLVNLRISVWTARKKDKNTEAQVISDNNARSSKAASVHKHLLADAEPLMAISRFAGDCRQWLYMNTLAWGDNGDRLLPTKNFFTFKQETAQRETHFWQLVHVFEREYPILITSMAMQLGNLFNRNEYPDPRTIAEKFGFNVHYTPMPEAGDFRVDIPADAVKELRASYASEADKRVEAAMNEAWQRLHDTIVHMKDKLTPAEDGKTKRIHETMLINAGELCAVLTALNITNDPKLEEARRKLEGIVERTDTTSLREVPEMRESVKKQLDDVLGKFNF